MASTINPGAIDTTQPAQNQQASKAEFRSHRTAVQLELQHAKDDVETLEAADAALQTQIDGKAAATHAAQHKSGGADVINLDELGLVDPTGKADGDILVWRVAGGSWVVEAKPAGGAGEANTASNVGAGVGIFKAKTGVDLEFKSLTAEGGVSVAASGADEVKVSTRPTVVEKTASYSIASTDEGVIIEVNSASAVTITLTAQAVGFQVVIVNKNTGTVTLAADTGQTLNAKFTALKSQWGAATAYVSAANTWIAFGDLS